LFFECGSKLDLQTILSLATIITKIVQNIHNKGYVIRDIKPENFLASLDKKQIFICDFGLAK
jgi:casein kinase 1 epsilon